jgi:hypothetical protein
VLVARKCWIPALILAGAAVLLAACRNPADSLQVGGIYSIDDGGGKFGAVKLLVHEEGICHLRLYKQRFPLRPTKADVGGLSIGSIHDRDGFSLGHMPIPEEGFLDWKPVLITRLPVTPEELEGYEMWKNPTETFTLQ